MDVRAGSGEPAGGHTDGETEEEDITQEECGRILEDIARVRGCLIKGGQSDWQKASDLLLDDFRSGRLGRITLELPPV